MAIPRDLGSLVSATIALAVAGPASAECRCTPLLGTPPHLQFMYPTADATNVPTHARIIAVTATTSLDWDVLYQQGDATFDVEGQWEVIGRTNEDFIVAWKPDMPLPNGVRVTAALTQYLRPMEFDQLHYRVGTSADVTPPSVPTLDVSGLSRSRVAGLTSMGESCETIRLDGVLQSASVRWTGATDDRTRPEHMLYELFVYAEGGTPASAPSLVVLGGWPSPPTSCAPVVSCAPELPRLPRWVLPSGESRACFVAQVRDGSDNVSGRSEPVCAGIVDVTVDVDEAGATCRPQMTVPTPTPMPDGGVGPGSAVRDEGCQAIAGGSAFALCAVMFVLATVRRQRSSPGGLPRGRVVG